MSSRKELPPEDWEPNERSRQVARAHGLDPDEFRDVFVDGCHANGYRYVNFDAAYRNWARRRKPQPNEIDRYLESKRAEADGRVEWY